MRRAGRIALCATLLLVAPAGAWAADFEVDRDSGRVEFQGPGNLVLTESGRETPGAGGRLGFATTDGWFHATRVLERSRRFLLATDDPQNRTISVRLDHTRSGVRMRAHVTGGPPPT